MGTTIRQKKIIQLIHKHRGLSIQQLSKKLGVSLNTVRSDIKNIVENNHNIKKQHGEIILITEPEIDVRYKNFIIEKKKIGQVVLKHLLTYESPSIFIDSSTTTYMCVQEFISAQKKATLVTNAVDIMLHIKNDSNVSVIGCGGLWWGKEHCFIGENTEKGLKQYQVDIALIGASGITKDGGVFNGNIENTKIKQIMAENSKEVWVVVESIKFDKNALIKFIDLSNVTKIFTEKKLPYEWEQLFENKGIQYFY